MGLKNRTNGTLTLFNFDGSVFTPIALCAGCEIGPGGPVGHNAHDEMIVYKNKLYILGRAPQPPPYDYDYIETLLIYDGTTITYNQNLYLQYPEKHNQLYIYDNLLFQSYEQSGFDGNSFVYPRLFYPSITIDDQYRQHAWIYGNTLGRTVYNGAVYSASAEIYFAPELDFYRRRLYAWSKIESKAREIFLPDGWYFKGDQYEEFDTHLIDFNCRLFMFLNHAQQGQKLVAMVESYINTCDFTPIFNSTVSFNVYPNPNNGTFTLKSSDALSEEFYDVKIFNDKGMLMLQQKVSSNKENTFDCTAFPKGLYHIIISNNKGESTMKRVNMQ